jgi:hypothetical protein
MIQKVFVTKYALTQGIFDCEMDVTLNPEHFKKKCWGKFTPHSMSTGLYNDDFQLTMEEAIADANKRKDVKIASLMKQIAKLEKLKF